MGRLSSSLPPTMSRVRVGAHLQNGVVGVSSSEGKSTRCELRSATTRLAPRHESSKQSWPTSALDHVQSLATTSPCMYRKYAAAGDPAPLYPELPVWSVPTSQRPPPWRRRWQRSARRTSPKWGRFRPSRAEMPSGASQHPTAVRRDLVGGAAVVGRMKVGTFALISARLQEVLRLTRHQK